MLYTAVAGVLCHKFDENLTRPIVFVSRALNKAKKNYSTLEKEALAIIFSVTKLRQYLLGYSFILQTDHKLLLTIFGEHNGIPVMAAARMQRWAFTLSGFNYSIEYIKGTLNSADSLSRISQYESKMSKDESSYINYIDLPNNVQLNYKNVAIHTRRDPILSKLLDSIQNGSVKDLNGDEFKSFRLKAFELIVESGCILWGYRTVIPTKLQNLVLQDLHASHLGIVKTKSLARSYVYWPRLDKDIEDMIKKCEPCQSTQASPEKSASIPWAPTDSAWKRIHIDYAGPVRGFNFFILIDSYSKWPEVFKNKDMTTSFTIRKMREVISHFGLFDVLVSDNGTQFVSKEFQKFLEYNNIQHIRTAPGHPATNGQAENFVKTLKKTLLANQNIQILMLKKIE